MAKITTNKDSITTISGKVLSLDSDGMGLVVKSAEYDRGAKVFNDVELHVRATVPVQDVEIGKNVTVVGNKITDFANPGALTINAAHIAGKPSCFEYGTMSVVNGEVMFASYNEELDVNGQPKMSAEYTNEKGEVVPAHPKKPHFDVAIQAIEQDENGKDIRVLHTVKAYPFKNDTTSIDRYKKLFNNYNHKENPAIATIITQPGIRSSRINVVGDKEYLNHYCNHIGINSIDVEFLNERTKSKSTPSTVKADEKVQPETSIPAPAETTNVPVEDVKVNTNGFEDGTIDMADDAEIGNLFV